MRIRAGDRVVAVIHPEPLTKDELRRGYCYDFFAVVGFFTDGQDTPMLERLDEEEFRQSWNKNHGR